MKKRTIFTAALLMLLQSCQSESSQTIQSDVSFLSNGDGTCQVKQNLLKEKVVVPSHSPSGDVVISIAELGFASQDIIKEIVLPDTITSFGKYAFFNSEIETINTPKSLETIGDFSFSNCRSLASFSFCEGIKTIGKEAFMRCSNFDGNLSLPDTIVSIGIGAFSFMSDITDIRIPSSLTFFPDRIFNSTDIKSTLVIPGSMKYVNFDSIGSSQIDTMICSEGVQNIYGNATTLDSIYEQYSTKVSKIFIPKTVEKLSVFFNSKSIPHIFCEAESLPKSWDKAWQQYEERVVWGATIDSVQ